MLRALITVIVTTISAVSLGQTSYELSLDSQRQAGIPQGEIIQLRFEESEIYRNTERDWWIYVPDQYDGQTPAALMVFQDGAAYLNETGSIRVPVVFDNLIHRGEMPVTIGVFVNPGHFIGDNPEGPARNRSLEYDSTTDVYSRFLLEEIIPEVQKSYRITDNREGWAIAGLSSGGICAFTVAWQRPDKFSKVVSHIGSFTNIRGGHLYSDLVRQSSVKPIRIFLQDGSNDLNLRPGNWWIANQQLADSLDFAGYDYMTAWGDGGHDLEHGGSIFPETMRWLWRDYDSRP